MPSNLHVYCSDACASLSNLERSKEQGPGHTRSFSPPSRKTHTTQQHQQQQREQCLRASTQTSRHTRGWLQQHRCTPKLLQWLSGTQITSSDGYPYACTAAAAQRCALLLVESETGKTRRVISYHFTQIASHRQESPAGSPRHAWLSS